MAANLLRIWLWPDLTARFLGVNSESRSFFGRLLFLVRFWAVSVALWLAFAPLTPTSRAWNLV